MIYNLLKHIVEIRTLEFSKLFDLVFELRKFIIDEVSTKEGHLGASLGVVELTIALHYVYKTPFDKIIWDVGHQAYGHKILTGRKDTFHTNRQLGGISGFPKITESEYDTFGTGHSSTSLSAILGMAISAKLQQLERQHIAVIGDASIVSGMAFEALNHIGSSNTNVTIILNDNGIGIDYSVGALKDHFKSLIINKEKQNNIFEAFNISYFGPIDGHNLTLLIDNLESLKTLDGPKLLHIKTIKGKGLKKAEIDQVTYHAPGKFDAVTGELISNTSKNEPTKYQDVFGLTLLELAEKNENIIGITPAMPSGSSLKYMMDKFPDRAFDVGIAEQHAVTFAAGLAADGKTPYCTIYSTFLQRAYDQIIHDVALQNLPVIFCVDRAGLVGEDGATHHGVFDLAYLRCIPNLIIVAPRNEIDFRNILYTSQLGLKNPIAIRYPRGRGLGLDWKKSFTAVEIGKGTCLREGKKIAILSLGSISKNVSMALENIPDHKIGHYDLMFLKPLDETLLHFIFKSYEIIVTIEDGSIIGGFGSAIAEFSNNHDYHKKVVTMGIPDRFIEHGSIQELQKECGLDPDSIKNLLLELLVN